MEIFSLYDSVAEQFGQPMFAPNSAVVVRELAALIRGGVQENSPSFVQHPTDYELYLIGKFNPDTGVISPPGKPERVVRLEALAVK